MLIVNTITVFIVDTLPQQTTKILRKSVFDKDKYIYIVYATAHSTYVWSDILTMMYGNIYILQHIYKYQGCQHYADMNIDMTIWWWEGDTRGLYVILLHARMDPPLRA